MKEIVRFITQLLSGGMLIFGAVTLLPRSLHMFRSKDRSRGVLYLFLGTMCLLFGILAFLMALSK